MNPLANAPIATLPQGGAPATVESNRAIAEVQAAVFLAKQFPRNLESAWNEVEAQCKNSKLAEVASYEYSRGGTKIEGPSIRLAEVFKMAFGNIHSGWRELGRMMINGVPHAEIEAWAWDVEKNIREPIAFKVKLMRDTKKGSYPLTDERDVYEHCANQAKRRERACILSLIPLHLQESALEICKNVLMQSANPETVRKMVEAFGAFGVTPEQIEKFIQKKIEAISPSQVVRLRSIFTSLKDGVAKTEDFFEVVESATEPAEPKREPVTKPENVRDAIRDAASSQRVAARDKKYYVEKIMTAKNIEQIGTFLAEKHDEINSLGEEAARTIFKTAEMCKKDLEKFKPKSSTLI